ncbi:MAG: excinuclease ABC subunit C [Candidatus Yanofskybacteria bacterium GW2011_GWA1_48_10]|uniref:Excinuclease ABC subunit C n=2 Tax=Candidatus Yanofskyibacteriota TaxID=1752733 RepID=A0A0G1U4L0_9BACT|nr:MAG: excinuclease ABC subunit C [Candidatus Yanofskybacteria bacterium GW2011_GWA1_48_10]OGN06708.1 MAG: hypothetical protein A2669_00010 [Candidatus Yanofskybacteria bacterium RIFCSPHIGHO2_01_FULL_48_25b]
MNKGSLQKIIKSLPDSAGIYRFQDKKGKDIYIGKAASIRKRLLSYAKSARSATSRNTNALTPIDSRISEMISQAEKLAYIETDSDIEALILESQLIKQKRPIFNTMLRDDKSYFFVGFTQDIFPRVILTHQPKSEAHELMSSRAHFIGPFTDGSALKATLKYLRGIFPYCTCKQKHYNYCLNYHIGKCPGFCCLKNSPERSRGIAEEEKKYQSNITAIKDILSGKKNSLVKKLKDEMERMGKKHEFDKAIELRNKADRLERVFYNAKVINYSEILRHQRSGLAAHLKIKRPIIRIEGYDVSNIQGKYAAGSMVTFIDGKPNKNYYRRFKILTKSSPDDTAMLREVLERRFQHEEWAFPDLVLIDGGKGQTGRAIAVLQNLGIKIPVIGISKDDKHLGHQLIIPDSKKAGWRVIPLVKLPAEEKALLLEIDNEAHRFAVNYYRHLHRKMLA